MVARNFYDVIVIGTQLGPLLTAAMLVRRGFRVLVLGHDDLPWTYRWGEHRLQREPFTLAGSSSPAVRRVLAELSLSQIFRRRASVNDPHFQVVLPDQRVDFVSDPDLFSREIEREFPEARRAIEGFYAVVDRCNPELDQLFGADLVLPPETFFERRDLARAEAHNPFSSAHGPVPLFGDLPATHPYRVAVAGQLQWASDLDVRSPSALQTVRLHASWARGTMSIDGGLEGLKALVLERIATHSGDVRPELRADRIALRRGRVAGVRMEGQDEVTGCNFVVLGADAHHLPGLVDVDELGKHFAARLPQVRPSFSRFTLNVIVEAIVVPEGMADNVVYIPHPDQPLHEENLLRIEVCGAPPQETRTLCIGALLPIDRLEEPGYIAGMRERIVDRLRWLIPFLDQHLIAIDSPHDGRPLQDLQHQREEILGQKWARQPGRMPTVCTVSPPGPLDVTGLPHRTGLKNLLLACRQVVPGLGLEGEFLSAWGAAHIITKSDRRKRKFRRETWSKIDM